MKVKVCGLRDGANISEVTALGVDYIGMIFWSGSPRNVTMVPTNAGIIPDRASLSPLTDCPPARGGLSEGLRGGSSPQRVGVFVDEMPQTIITKVVNYELDVVQLHGHETPTVIRNLRATLDPDIRPGIQFWKAISVSSVDDLAVCTQYEGCVEAFVFDTRCDSVGGSGKQFDWQMLEAYHGSVPFLLSGGIGPDDAEHVKSFRHPMCMGIDLNSRFETAPAVKDVNLLKSFLAKLK
ncbi:MAG: phosphoribosylanthranilate isomerase [Prevotella sp.]|nr:phosphoribosylanthranilate isomerase [Prevotella sp.]